MLNRYFKRSRISEAKFRYILYMFANDLTAVQIAKLSGVSGVSVNRILKALRTRGHNPPALRATSFEKEDKRLNKQ